MRHARAYGLAGLAGIAIAAVAFAQTTPPATADAKVAAATPAKPGETPATTTAATAANAGTAPNATPALPAGGDAGALDALAKTQWGDPKAGGTKAGACAACHGLDGNSTANPALYPRIAGQGEMYVARQLAMFKSGHRTGGNAALMIPFAVALSPQDMRDLGAHYQAQASGAGVADATVVAEGPYAGKPLFEVGQTLYRSGDGKRGIVACAACHGPDGAGNPGASYPHVGGQQSWYVERRLGEYRSGNAPVKDDKTFALMAAETKSLSDVEIKGLAAYLQGLHNRAYQASAAEVAALRASQGLAPVAAPQPTPAPAAAAEAGPAAPAASEPSRPLGGS